MKRILFILVAVVILLCSCQSKSALLARDYYREEALLKDIAQAIETNNTDSLLSIFSNQAKEESTVIEEDIKQFLAVFSDEDIMWQKRSLSSREYEYDNVVMEETIASYDLYAGNTKYTVFLIWWSSNDHVESEELQARLGVYTLRIVEEDDCEEQYEHLHYSRMEIPGVYYKPTRLYKE